MNFFIFAARPGDVAFEHLTGGVRVALPAELQNCPVFVLRMPVCLFGEKRRVWSRIYRSELLSSCVESAPGNSVQVCSRVEGRMKLPVQLAPHASKSGFIIQSLFISGEGHFSSLEILIR